MKVTRARVRPDMATEQAWELANDLAIYQAWKPFLEPLSAGTTIDGDDSTYRALVIQVEEDGELCCMDRVGTLDPCGHDRDVVIDAGHVHQEHAPASRFVARMLHPVSRALRRVRRATHEPTHRGSSGRRIS